MNLQQTILSLALLSNISIFLLVLKGKCVSRQERSLFLGYLTGVFLWIGGILMTLQFPQSVPHLFGSGAYIAAQIFYLGAGLAMFFPYWFFRSYKNKSFSWGYKDALACAIFVVYILLLLWPNTFFSQVEVFESYVHFTRERFVSFMTFYIFFFYGLILFSILQRLKSEFHPIYKKQIQYMGLSYILFTTIAIFTNWIVAAMFNHPEFNAFGPCFYLIEVGFFIYAATRYRFFDIPLALQAYASYITNIAVYAIVFRLIWAGNYSMAWQIDHVPLGMVFGFLVLTGWHKTLPFSKKGWNFLLYRRTTNFIDDVRGSLDVFQESVDKGLDVMSEALGIDGAQWVTVESSKGKDFASSFQRFSTDTLVRDEISYRREHLGEIWPRKKDSKRYKRWLREIDETMQKYLIAVALPIQKADGTLLGFILLKEKLDGNLFSSQELNEVKRLLQYNARAYLVRETEEKKLQRQLRQGSNKTLMNDFFHEVQHPLMVVQNLEHLVDERKLTEDNKEAFELAHGAARELRNKLDGLNEVFQWQQNGKTLSRKWHSIEPFMRSVLQEVFGEHPDWKKSVELSIQISAFAYQIYVDKPALVKVFVALIKNGLFFNESSPKKVGIYFFFDPGEGLSVQITDNGMGIPERSWEDVFQPLRVLSPSRNEQECGLGVGLPLSREIMEAHGGELFVKKSEKRKGTTLVLNFPLGALKMLDD